MNVSERSKKRWAVLAAAAGCALWLAAETVPAEAQATRTRPGGSSSSSASGGGSGGSSTASRGGSSGGSSTRSSGPTSVRNTRPITPPPSASGSPTVVENRRPGTSRRHRDGFRGGGHYYGGYYGSFGYPYYGYHWSPFRYGLWGMHWWYPWYPHGYPPGPYGYGGYGVDVFPSQVRSSMGALDTDIWPGKAQVWINGQYVGYADQFDGFPRYLWLEKGTYDVVFYLEGFETLARQYSIYPGLVIDVEDRLEPGEAVHPTALAPKETPRRDERVREDRERPSSMSEPEWRRRVRSDRASRAPGSSGAPAASGSVDARGEPGRVQLDIEPSDAAVYLDGRFVGTAAELAEADGGLLVDPGEHELEVVRPGMTSQTIEFEVEAGEELELGVELEES